MNSMKLGRVRWWFAAAIAACSLALISLAPDSVASQGDKVPKYIGAAKCKSCHSKAESGNQYEVWAKAGHSKAYELLASEESKKAGAAAGVDDPQKSDKCLKCHTTAFGVAPEGIAKGFDMKAGVQCESCHGPGEAHMKARLKAAATATEGDTKPVVLGEGEIVTNPQAAVCTGCHNAESPSYKPFCYFKSRDKIAHLNPQRVRTPEEEKETHMKCGCGDKCPTADCATGKCGVPGDAK